MKRTQTAAPLIFRVMQPIMDTHRIENIALQIEKEFQTGGLFEGIYKDFSIELVKRVFAYAKKAILEDIEDVQWVDNSAYEGRAAKEALKEDIDIILRVG